MTRKILSLRTAPDAAPADGARIGAPDPAVTILRRKLRSHVGSGVPVRRGDGQ